MGLFNKKETFVAPQDESHNCDDYQLLRQEGPNVRYFCGKCDKTIRVERDIPPPHY